MLKKILLSALSGVLFLTTSCASIVSKSTYSVGVDSVPQGAKFTIKNDSNVIVTKGVTPAVVDLDADDGFFTRAKYTIALENQGYEPLSVPLKAKIDGWYFGNIIFGGLIGLVLVDPATGAMWKLPNGVCYEMNPLETQE